MGSETKQIEPHDVPEASGDHVIGGFTVVSEKTKPKSSQVTEIYPYWIQHGHTFSANLSEGKQVDDVEILNPSIQKRLLDLGYTVLFPVQLAVIPYILNSYRISKYRPLGRPRDLCVCAPTGSGKTLAYTIPIIQLLQNRSNIFVRCIIVLPVRDLAIQIYNVIKQLVQEGDIKVALLAGLKSFNKEQADLIEIVDGFTSSKVDIVVTTPGRLVDHLYNTPGFNLSRLRFLVIDEADRVIAEEKQDWYHALEEALYHRTVFGNPDKLSNPSFRRRRPITTIDHQYDMSHDITLQKILVSATLTHDPGPLKQFNLYFPCLFTSCVPNEPGLRKPPSQGIANATDQDDKVNNTDKTENPDDAADIGQNETEENNQIKTTTGVGTFTTPSGLQEFLISVRLAQRPLFLVHLVRDKNMKRILCFTNARPTASRLYVLLKNFANIHVSCLSGKMPTEKRQRILNSFSRGDSQILVCTDAVARGIDIPNVECVVSYEMPHSIKIYVHRVGRTARAGKMGIAYTLLENNQFRPFMNDLRKVGKSKIRKLPFHGSHVNHLRHEYQTALANLQASFKPPNPADSKSYGKDIHSTPNLNNHHGSRKRKLDPTRTDSVEVVTPHSIKKKKRKLMSE